ncbi:MAG: hypothetical protein IH961_10655, partial [Chloroflexi bacterium]|nr:hypothetical protein [Chloroflexota bacterium]
MPTERIQKRIDALLDEADEAVGQQDWIAVRRLCDAVLRLDHENADARAYLEASEYDTGIDVGDPQPETPVESPEMASEASPETPTSFANGRYEVTGFLGEGGKKKVYLV